MSYLSNELNMEWLESAGETMIMNSENRLTLHCRREVIFCFIRCGPASGELNRAAHFGYGNLLKKLFATSATQQRTQDAADDFPSDGGADGAGDAFGCGLN